MAGGNVETSQRIVDVLLRALARAAPERIPAASCGSMNNLAFGGTRPAPRPFAYYETIAGGAGGGPAGPGASAVHTHMTNTLNTPIEALEAYYPLRVRRYAVRRGSGGRGRHRGGDGVVREIEFLTDAEVTLLTERRRVPPWGLAGGGPGSPGRDSLTRDGRRMPLPAKTTLRVRAGDRLCVETPGGGGFGTPPASATMSSGRLAARRAALELVDPALEVCHLVRAGDAGPRDHLARELAERGEQGAQPLALCVQLLGGRRRALAHVVEDDLRIAADERGDVLTDATGELAAFGLHARANLVERAGWRSWLPWYGCSLLSLLGIAARSRLETYYALR